MKRKVILVALLVLVTAITASVLVACNPAELEKIVGTYKLVTDTRTEYQQDTVDYIARDGREAYIVLTGTDYGYFVYKDNDTAAFARKVKLEYYKNDENKVTSITYVLGVGEKKSRSLNVNAQKEISLVSRWTSANKIMDAYDLQYNKISDKTDLSTVKKELGDMPVFDYDLYQYHSMYSASLLNGVEKNFGSYIYKYYDVNTASCTATLYYALREDEKPVVQNNLAVSFTRNEDNDKPISMTIGDETYTLENGIPQRSVTVTISEEEFDGTEELSWFSLDQTEYTDLAAYFDSLIAEYKQPSQQA